MKPEEVLKLAAPVIAMHAHRMVRKGAVKPWDEEDAAAKLRLVAVRAAARYDAKKGATMKTWLNFVLSAAARRMTAAGWQCAKRLRFISIEEIESAYRAPAAVRAWREGDGLLGDLERALACAAVASDAAFAIDFAMLRDMLARDERICLCMRLAGFSYEAVCDALAASRGRRVSFKTLAETILAPLRAKAVFCGFRPKSKLHAACR